MPNPQPRIFTHNQGSREDWSQLYPYTVIAYRFAKRIYLEFKTPQEIADNRWEESHAAAYVITPNGKVWEYAAFFTAFDAVKVEEKI